jgi:hypothetical protein
VEAEGSRVQSQPGPHSWGPVSNNKKELINSQPNREHTHSHEKWAHLKESCQREWLLRCQDFWALYKTSSFTEMGFFGGRGVGMGEGLFLRQALCSTGWPRSFQPHFSLPGTGITTAHHHAWLTCFC